MEEKMFTSSLNICQDAFYNRDGGSNVSPLTTILFELFPSWSLDISFKDDVTVILLLAVSFMASLIHTICNSAAPVHKKTQNKEHIQQHKKVHFCLEKT